MKKFWKTAALAMLTSLTLASCATIITLSVPRTPTLDTSGIKRLAVMPFESPNRTSLFKSAAQYATTVATSSIRATNNFILVSPIVIGPRRRAGQNFDDLADALFIGRIIQINEKTDAHEGERKDKETGEKVKYTYYVREVEVEFTYSFVRSLDGTILGPVTRKGHANDTNEFIDKITSVEVLVKKVIDTQMKYMHMDIAPYTTTVFRSLAKEPGKSIRPEMNSALMYVKSGNYMAARNAYAAIYESYKSMAAAENASILFEALGQTEAGADFMQRVFNETGNPRAQFVLARLNKELQEIAGTSGFRDKTARSPIERVSVTASDEIQRHLAGNAKVWIINKSAAEDELMNSIVDNVVSALLRNGVTIVDRQNTDLIQTEQIFQRSGHVSDDDIVRIGSTAGANRIIIMSVSGTGAARRLQVRLLDVERGTLLMQSDIGERWNF
jgi:hypothetical protein